MKKIITKTCLLSLLTIIAISCKDNKDKRKPTLNLTTKKATYETKESYEKEEDNENKAIAVEERWKHDFRMQMNPLTGKIPELEKRKEFESAILQKQNANFNARAESAIISRGPSNLGGRTRAFKIDLSDATGNTILAGGVSSGVFRTTNGGQNWVKVSPFDEIHNVTTIAQDPREGFQNIWYYGTGELRGNSATRGGAFFKGNGIWKSVDGGISWEQIPVTDSSFENFDSTFDLITDMEVHPITGELFVATLDAIIRMTDTEVNHEIDVTTGNNSRWTDLEITSTGRVYAAIDARTSQRGVYTSENGNGNWDRIANNGSPEGWNPARRITLALAPSNENYLYVLYDNGSSTRNDPQAIEADIWRYDRSTNSWIDFSSKMPDEPNGDLAGNDPFSHQGSYDLVVSVKPDDENFVVIGGTNAYKISNIETSTMFQRIGGYISETSYGLYNKGGVDHHPDIHAFAWDPNNPSILYSGTDGGVHRTDNINDADVTWTNINNDYLTYQYYYVTMLNIEGSDIVMGGAQDNGTTIGGLDVGFDNSSEMSVIFGGDGVSVGLAPIEEDGENNLYRYLGVQNGPVYRVGPRNGTTEITPIDNSIPGSPEEYPSKFVTYFYLDPENPSTLYYASETTVLRLNSAETGNSNSWVEIGALPFQEEVTVYEASKGAYDSESSYLLIGGENGRVYKLNDPINAENFNNASSVTPPGVFTGNSNTSGQYVSSLAVHPTNKDIAMVTYSSYGSDIRNIFITFNMTARFPSWIEVENNLESHSVRAAAIAEVNEQTIFYVGTNRGLYRSSDPENENWSLVGGDIMGIPVISNLVYRNSDKKLLIGTHGNGMYEADLNNAALSTNSFNESPVELAVYPNPVIYKLNFASNDVALNDATKYTIYDIRGREIMSGNLNRKSIDVSSLSSGNYVVKLLEGNKNYSKKFIKN